jgi:2-keto-4-pentenoate hydratase/2-oxohepta-3-ene-1,7-dioic acid hydratase in catechol pathway
MKLIVYDRSRVGILRQSDVVDVSDLVGASEEWPPTFFLRMIRGFDRLRPILDEAVRTRPGLALDRVHLGAPVVFPSKIIAAPANYRKHIDEAVRQPEAFKRAGPSIETYGVFLKAPSSIIGPGDSIGLPFADRRTDHEVELGVVIGRTARDIPRTEALRYVFGYTGLIDVSVRGEEERTTRKSFDTFTPVGPVLVTADEIPDPGDVRLQLWVNGVQRQDGNTRDMIWNVARLIEYASHVMTLHPGDLIATGTPEGVGPLSPGDDVTIEVEKVGRMTLRVAPRREIC